MAAPKQVTLIITKKCRVNDEHKVPGSKVTVPEEDSKVLIGLGKATTDLEWKPASKPVAKKDEKKDENKDDKK